jgi:predicted transcriptional regulator
MLSVPPPEGDPGWSGKTLAATLGVPLGDISYHFRTLRSSGLLAVAGRRQVRGAVQTFYRLSPEATIGT